MAKFIDLAKLPEDDRIKLIGKQVFRGLRVGFVVDKEGSDGMAKADRYIRKLQASHPGTVVHSKHEGPVAGMVSVVVSCPVQPNNN